MMRPTLVLAAVLCLATPARSEWSAQVIALSPTPDAPLVQPGAEDERDDGPSGFIVADDGSIRVLGPDSSVILQFDADGELVSSQDLRGTPRQIEILGSGDLVALPSGRLASIALPDDGELAPRHPVAAAVKQNGDLDTLPAGRADELARAFHDESAIATCRPGLATCDLTWQLRGQPRVRATVSAEPGRTLLAAWIHGIDEQGRRHVLVESADGTKVTRRLEIFTPAGESQASLDLPLGDVPLERDVVIDGRGRVSVMTADADGKVTIHRFMESRP